MHVSAHATLRCLFLLVLRDYDAEGKVNTYVFGQRLILMFPDYLLLNIVPFYKVHFEYMLKLCNNSILSK